MKLFYYCANCGYSEYVAGVLKANSKQEAETILKAAYDDYDEWEDSELKEIDLNETAYHEIYYG